MVITGVPERDEGDMEATAAMRGGERAPSHGAFGSCGEDMIRNDRL
jgi:hypothetical protein